MEATKPYNLKYGNQFPYQSTWIVKEGLIFRVEEEHTTKQGKSFQCFDHYNEYP